MNDFEIVGAAMFVALLVTRKDAPMGIARWLRSSGFTVLNCTLCCFGWSAIGLYVLSASPISARVQPMAHAAALVGYGWLAIALVGLAGWDA